VEPLHIPHTTTPDCLRKISSMQVSLIPKRDLISKCMVDTASLYFIRASDSFLCRYRLSQHHYSGSFCTGSGDLLQNLMTKSTIRSNLSSFSPDIDATFEQGLEYILGETNSYSCHGAPGVSNTAGAALWALDYVLYASQIGISRVHFHEGIGYKYNLVRHLTPSEYIQCLTQ
jgi:hypothetical protein